MPTIVLASTQITSLHARYNDKRLVSDPVFIGTVSQAQKRCQGTHMLMELKGSILCFISIPAGSVHEVNIIDQLAIELGVFYIMDCSFTDFAQLYTVTESMSYFVIRAKANLDFTHIAYCSVDKSTDLRIDQSIMLKDLLTLKYYPVPLRRISYYDCNNHRKLIFLTNNFTLESLTIARSYKCPSR
jgi:hypothetical protein